MDYVLSEEIKLTWHHFNTDMWANIALCSIMPEPTKKTTSRVGFLDYYPNCMQCSTGNVDWTGEYMAKEIAWVKYG